VNEVEYKVVDEAKAELRHEARREDPPAQAERSKRGVKSLSYIPTLGQGQGASEPEVGADQKGLDISRQEAERWPSHTGAPIGQFASIERFSKQLPVG
jgi:hypothetical protein